MLRKAIEIPILALIILDQPPAVLDSHWQQVHRCTTAWQRLAIVEELPEQLRDPMEPITSEPSMEVGIFRVVLQARLVEVEASGAVADVDGGEFPFGIGIIDAHYHAPRETGTEVELLIRAVQEADRGGSDGFKGRVALAGTGVVAGNVEPVLVLVAVAFDAGLEVVAAWRGDGSVCG